LAVLALIVTQVVSWGTVQRVPGSDTSAVKMYIDNLSIGAFAFELGLLPLLALTGAALATRSANRRTFALAGVGVAAGVAVVLAGMIRSLMSPTPEVLLGQASEVGSLSLGLGPYAAVAALGLLIASLVLCALPPRGTRSAALQATGGGRLLRRPRLPSEVAPEEPLDLTVTPAPPINRRLLGD